MTSFQNLRYHKRMKSRIVSATELKAKCLALLDEVDDQGHTITVTKRGRPIATIQPLKKKRWKPLKGAWIGKVEIVGDIVGFETTHLWDALRKEQEI